MSNLLSLRECEPGLREIRLSDWYHLQQDVSEGLSQLHVFSMKKKAKETYLSGKVDAAFGDGIFLVAARAVVDRQSKTHLYRLAQELRLGTTVATGSPKSRIRESVPQLPPAPSLRYPKSSITL